MPVLDPVLRKDREMERTDVWFGSMTHGSFNVGHDDLEPMVVIHSIDERLFMPANDADDYMAEHGYDSYVMPSIFTGSIVFSKAYVRSVTTERIEK